MKEDKNNTKLSGTGLEPIMSLTMAEMVEVKLLEYFKKNDFELGDSIPKEVELAEALGVSRNVIREALSRFRMLGLIESKKKKGMTLKSPDLFGGLERILHPGLLSNKTMREIFEMRLIIEMGIADIVFVKKTDQDIKDLKKLVEKRKKHETLRFKLEHEVDFHGKLYSITENETLIRFQNLLLPIFKYVYEYESKMTNPPKTGRYNHADLLRELNEGTPESFRHAMFLHLEPHFDMLKSWKNTDV